VAIGKDGAVTRQLRTLFRVGTVRELTDGQLLELFATERGEVAELAFAALVERHGAMVQRVCQGVLNNPHDSQDALQATFLVLVQKARGLWVRDSLGPWLHQVAFRTASCSRSSAARHRRIERQAARSKEEAFVAVDDEPGRILHQEIDRLPDRFRAPVILCDLQGRSHEQAARHLGWPIGTVKSRHSRGRERLRHRLERRGMAPNTGLIVASLALADNSATLPPLLVDSTARAALEFATIHTFLKGSVVTLAQGVLRSMSATRYLRAISIVLFVGATVSGAGWLAGRSTTLAVAQAQEKIQVPRGAELITYSVKPGPLLVNVIGPGNLEPSRSEDHYCNVEGQTAIISLMPEGSAIKKGDFVCELDSAALRDQLTNQQIAEKQSAADYERAKLARETAQLAVSEFVEGKLPSERERLKAEIGLAQSALGRAEASLKRARDAQERLKAVSAARPGSDTAVDVAAELDIADRRDTASQTIERQKKVFELATAQLSLLEKYSAPKTTRELQIDVEQKRLEELAKKVAWQLAQSKSGKLEKMIGACAIRAASDGMLVYANELSPRSRMQPTIEEGATVRERQKIFQIIDLRRPLRVNAKMPESMVDQLVQGMQTRVRVDAFPNMRFNGKVTDISPLPDATNFYSDIKKVYTTHVLLNDGIPALRPGMTVQAEIIIKDLDSVLAVPISAVLSYDDQDHIAVKKPDGGIVWSVVTLGVANDRFVEIKEGLQSGDQVVANPLVLLTEDEKRAKFGKKVTDPAKRAGKKAMKGAAPQF
jgi:RND family efflux transporter MFP subunit